jgi:hypothetical protein
MRIASLIIGLVLMSSVPGAEQPKSGASAPTEAKLPDDVMKAANEENAFAAQALRRLKVSQTP